MIRDIGLLSETAKPTKAPWFLRFAGAILRKIGSSRNAGGADKDGLLAKDAKGIVSFVQNLLPSRTQKEGVHPVQKAFRLKQHGIGLFTVFALVGIATVLTPIQTQASWKWLVETIASWGIGKTLDAATEAALNANGGVTITDNSPRANAIVNGADWLSNEWTYEYRVEWVPDSGVWNIETASASMGHQQEPKTAKGTKRNGTAMTQAEAVAELKHKKYSTRWVRFEIFDDDGYYDDVYASARTDSINRAVQGVFKRLRKFYKDNEQSPGTGWPNGTITLGPIWKIGTTTYNVGSYEAVSNFQNPSGNTALGKASAEDSEADQYTGTIYLEYSDISAGGNYSSKKKRGREVEFTTIKTRHAVAVDLLDNNESMIGEPKISAGAQRFFEDEEYTVWETQGPRTIIEIRLPPDIIPSRRVQVTYKRRVCNQTESDEHKKPN